MKRMRRGNSEGTVNSYNKGGRTAEEQNGRRKESRNKRKRMDQMQEGMEL